MWRKNKIKPEVVAAVSAALVAGGYLSEGDRIAGIYCKKQDNFWKEQDSLWWQAGLIELMCSRSLRRGFGS